MESVEYFAIFGHHQAPGSLAIKTVNKFEVLCVGPCKPQRFNNTAGQPAPAMDCNSARLIQNHQIIILIDNPVFNLAYTLFRNGYLVLLCCTKGWDTNFFASSDSVTRLDSPTVNAYLALSDETIDTALGHPLEVTHEIVIDALTRAFGININQTNLFYLK